MTAEVNTRDILQRMLQNGAKSLELGILLRGYATDQELLLIQDVVEKCREREKQTGMNRAGTLLSEFFTLSEGLGRKR